MYWWHRIQVNEQRYTASNSRVVPDNSKSPLEWALRAGVAWGGYGLPAMNLGRLEIGREGALKGLAAVSLHDSAVVHDDALEVPVQNRAQKDPRGRRVG